MARVKNGRSSRRKGAGGEREFFKLMNGLLGHEAFKRNLMQSRQGGADDSEHDLVAVEVKRVERLACTQWLTQAREQARKVNKIPVVAYRQSRQPWRVLIELTPEQFAHILKVLEWHELVSQEAMECQ